MLQTLTGEASGLFGPSPDALKDKLAQTDAAIKSFDSQIQSSFATLSPSFLNDWTTYKQNWADFSGKSSGTLAQLLGPSEIDTQINTYLSQLDTFKGRFSTETGKQTVATPGLTLPNDLSSVTAQAAKIGTTLAVVLIGGAALILATKLPKGD